jgi:hypothetical protein
MQSGKQTINFYTEVWWMLQERDFLSHVTNINVFDGKLLQSMYLQLCNGSQEY